MRNAGLTRIAVFAAAFTAALVGARREAAACTSNLDCPLNAPVCSGGSCRGCSFDSDCIGRGHNFICNVSTGGCVGCLSNADCTQDLPHCSGNGGSPGTCGICVSDSDCVGYPNALACQPVDGVTQFPGWCRQCSQSNATLCTAAPPDTCHDASACSRPTGTCVNPPKMDGAPCDDGNACTQSETCHQATCTSGTPVTCTPLDECHDAGTCDPSSGCSNPAKSDGTACSIGTCQGGVCRAPATSSSSSAGGSGGGASSSSAGGNGGGGGTTSSSMSGNGGGGASSSSGGLGGAGTGGASAVTSSSTATGESTGPGGGGAGSSGGCGCAAVGADPERGASVFAALAMALAFTRRGSRRFGDEPVSSGSGGRARRRSRV